MRVSLMRKTALSIIALSMFLSCSAGDSIRITLERTPVISGGLGWAVVSLAYVRLMSEPSTKAPDSSAIRRGEVARISARSRSYDERDRGVWYRLEIGARAGWGHEPSLTVYGSQAEAVRAAESGR